MSANLQNFEKTLTVLLTKAVAKVKTISARIEFFMNF